MALMASLDSGISALQSFSRGMEVIGDNIANINTVAGKGSDINYTDGFSNVLRSATASQGGTNPGSNQTVQQVGSGVAISTIQTDFRPGALENTGKATDLAIVGNGFFKVTESASNVSYATRAGNFRIDDRGYIVSQVGDRLQGYRFNAAAMPTYTYTSVNGVATPTRNAPTDPNAAGTIGDIRPTFSFSTTGGNVVNNTASAFTDDQINAMAPKLQSFSIDTSGDVTFLFDNGDSFKGGRILLLQFNDPQALVREGNGRYSGFAAAGVSQFDLQNGSPSTNGLGSLKANTLELSNVDLTKQFAKVITTQRSFQAGARVISVSDDILEEVVNLKR